MAGHIIASYKNTKAQSICSQNPEENPSEEKGKRTKQVAARKMFESTSGG
jgi:hypothetical protein